MVIVSPAVASNNNGNWHTALRWQAFLSALTQAPIVQEWDAGTPAAAMIALHARRSAPSIRRFREAHPDRAIALVLTGTDVYGNLAQDAQSQQSLRDATHLVVLQDQALAQLAPQDRRRARVIVQSATGLLPAIGQPGGSREFVAVGHLREVKDPLTFMRAARLLADVPDLQMVHVGNALEPGFDTWARETMAACPHYRWLGGLPHEDARLRIAGAHALVHMSRVEGGANVVIEAVCSAVPVIASRIDGNVGLLGADYDGYFPVGDATALATLMRRVAGDAAFHGALRAQCAKRAPMFLPAAEMRAVRALHEDMQRWKPGQVPGREPPP